MPGAADTPEVRAAFVRAVDDMKFTAGSSGVVTFVVNKAVLMAKIEGDKVTIGLCEYVEAPAFPTPPGMPPITVMVPTFKKPDA